MPIDLNFDGAKSEQHIAHGGMPNQSQPTFIQRKQIRRNPRNNRSNYWETASIEILVQNAHFQII